MLLAMVLLAKKRVSDRGEKLGRETDGVYPW
jgi:hypothetical protein